MSINRITCFTDKFEINIRKYGTGWHVQVMAGPASTRHVETVEFHSLSKAIEYVRENYAGGIEI